MRNVYAYANTYKPTIIMLIVLLIRQMINEEATSLIWSDQWLKMMHL